MHHTTNFKVFYYKVLMNMSKQLRWLLLVTVLIPELLCSLNKLHFMSGFYSAPALLVTVVWDVSALLRFNVLLPSTSINRRQLNLPLVSTACAQHFFLHCAISPAIFQPIPSGQRCLILKNLLPLKVLLAGQGVSLPL